jgi:hypothetical protein
MQIAVKEITPAHVIMISGFVARPWIHAMHADFLHHPVFVFA